ncbi:MAG: NUDIX hydrolase [Candidatus Spechtbacterales bacterium]
MNSLPIASFQVSLKALLRDGDKVLLLFDKRHGKVDFPGGRIDETESKISLIEVLQRELREELGTDVRYQLGQPLFQFKRYFPDTKNRVLVTIYDAKYLGGKIQLSEEHASYEWVNPNERQPAIKRFFGKEEYEAFARYIASRFS